MRLFAMSAALVLCASLVMLAPAQRRRPRRDCYDTAQTQAAMNQCAAKELEQADAELNRVYRQLLEANKEDRLFVEKMTQAERAWVAFRDAQMDALYPPVDNPPASYGSVFPMCYGRAKAKLTRERTQQLKAMLDVREGDVCR
ncbi:MAG TPA: lysozyme inhibitor LprI family protein [Pyrinomonadaceae bacterium]|nr:lysozyme inhibitor LprI family protein [Pyrinomonadaceae bacterium]